MKLARIKRIAVIAAIAVFFASVPFAMWYNRGYDKFGTINRERVPVFIHICTVDAGRYESTFKIKAAEYIKKNPAVTIFVNPQTITEIDGQNWDIKIISQEMTLYAFIAAGQSELEVEHCEKYLEKLGDIEGVTIEIKK